ncbi:MAG: hypothetical protein NG740_03145 [Omnitrophica bacterium]|nr:hypothetical protein [Candidatus Omnitrophota bacterium]
MDSCLPAGRQAFAGMTEGRGGDYDKAGYFDGGGDSGDFGSFVEYDSAQELAR